MNNKTLKDVIHLYVGCGCEKFLLRDPKTRLSTILSASLMEEVNTVGATIGVKLLLKPLSEMSEEDAKRLIRMKYAQDIKDVRLYNMGEYSVEAQITFDGFDWMPAMFYIAEMNPSQFLFLLSKGYDLYDGITHGWAVKGWESRITTRHDTAQI